MTAEATPALARRHAVFHDLRVACVEPLTSDSVAITFDVPAELASEYDFACGQHVSLRCAVAGDDVRRNYSICTSAGSGVLRVAVKRLPGGVFSSYAHSALRAGDTIEVMTPTGRFTTPLQPSIARSHVAIAAGSGIAPVLSIASTILAREPHSTVTLLYGNKTSQDIMFLEELEDLKNTHPARFALHLFLSRESQEPEILNGRIDGARLRALLASPLLPEHVDDWFLCGPQAMITSLRAALADAGADQRSVHSELFHAEARGEKAAQPAATDGAASGVSRVTIILDGRTSSFELRPDAERILDAALRVRNDAPYACKDGVCGTCRARLLEGSVAMEQNYALEDSELEAGFVLACQSHPTSPVVKLDFDG